MLPYVAQGRPALPDWDRNAKGSNRGNGGGFVPVNPIALEEP